MDLKKSNLALYPPAKSNQTKGMKVHHQLAMLCRISSRQYWVPIGTNNRHPVHAPLGHRQHLLQRNSRREYGHLLVLVLSHASLIHRVHVLAAKNLIEGVFRRQACLHIVQLAPGLAYAQTPGQRVQQQGAYSDQRSRTVLSGTCD
eukprot:4705060-Amphidinium_carterae.1